MRVSIEERNIFGSLKAREATVSFDNEMILNDFRAGAEDFSASANDDIRGIWASSTHMYVAEEDGIASRIYAYSLADQGRAEIYDIVRRNASEPFRDIYGIWGDESTHRMYVVESDNDPRINVYNLYGSEIESITINNGGSGYGSIQALGSVGGTLTGYTNNEPVTLTGGDGTGFTGSANVSGGSLSSVGITTRGGGYVSGTYTVVGGTSGTSTATVAVTAATFSFSIDAPDITEPAAASVQAVADITIDGSGTLTAINLTTNGAGYVAPVSATLTGAPGAGTGASLTVVLNNRQYSSEDIAITVAGANPTDISGDGTYIYVLDNAGAKSIHRYNRSTRSNTGTWLLGSEFGGTLNWNVIGLWVTVSGGVTTFYTLDSTTGIVYVLTFNGTTNTVQDGFRLLSTAAPRGLWSDGSTVLWTSSSAAVEGYEYRILRDFGEMLSAGEAVPAGGFQLAPSAFGLDTAAIVLTEDVHVEDDGDAMTLNTAGRYRVAYELARPTASPPVAGNRLRVFTGATEVTDRVPANFRTKLLVIGR